KEESRNRVTPPRYKKSEKFVAAEITRLKFFKNRSFLGWTRASLPQLLQFFTRFHSLPDRLARVIRRGVHAEQQGGFVRVHGVAVFHAGGNAYIITRVECRFHIACHHSNLATNDIKTVLGLGMYVFA